MKTKTKVINVTQKDIDRALDKMDKSNGYIHGNWCPVALAIRRTFKKNKWFATVCSDGTDAISIGRNKIVKAPFEVLEFTADFDAGLPVEPFSFKLEY